MTIQVARLDETAFDDESPPPAQSWNKKERIQVYFGTVQLMSCFIKVLA